MKSAVEKHASMFRRAQLIAPQNFRFNCEMKCIIPGQTFPMLATANSIYRAVIFLEVKYKYIRDFTHRPESSERVKHQFYV